MRGSRWVDREAVDLDVVVLASDKFIFRVDKDFVKLVKVLWLVLEIHVNVIIVFSLRDLLKIEQFLMLSLLAFHIGVELEWFIQEHVVFQLLVVFLRFECLLSLLVQRLQVFLLFPLL